MMLGEGIRQRGAAPHALEHIADDHAKADVRRQLAQDGQRAVERHAGLEQRGELLGEGQDVAAGDPPDASLRPRETEDATTLSLGEDRDRVVGVPLQPLDHGSRVGGFHDAIDGLSAPVPCPVREDRHARSLPP
jgi:hypothetical protein